MKERMTFKKVNKLGGKELLYCRFIVPAQMKTFRKVRVVGKVDIVKSSPLIECCFQIFFVKSKYG